MTEIRPIDGNSLLSKAETAPMYAVDAMVCYELITSEPTLDVVPVVRCKECLFSEKRHYLGDTCLYCKQFCDFMEESDFCCRAERKDGETK